jgi:hypothetical protein
MNNIEKYSCVTCKYFTNTKYCLDIHLESKKHIRNEKPRVLDPEIKFQCKSCNNQYKYASGLSAHAKKCRNTVLPAIDINASAISSQESQISILVETINKLTETVSTLAEKVAEQSNQLVQQQTINNNCNNNTMNNNFNMSVFLNDKCGNAINLEDFLKSILQQGFEKADKDKMINSYVEGTCDIIQKSLEELPLNKRPMHYLAGEDPHQQLMHIRQDDKWNTSSELNWMQQIHADDDDDVIDKNPIYYALKKIDDEKLNYLAYKFNQDKKYMQEHGRLHREISRPDFKEKVYREIFKLVTLHTDKLGVIDEKSKIPI